MVTPLEKTNNLQQLASNPKNSSWVFASAGSGKTKVLVDRVLRLLLADVQPDKILCLTFTKVAALEMQNRINQELANWVLLDEEKLDKKLTQLSGQKPNNQTLKKARILFTKILDEESKIKIQTIHSFCQNLVKIFPFEANIKPNFEVIEESQEKLLLQKSQKELFNKAKHDDQLREFITKINATLHEGTFAELVAAILRKKEQLVHLKENLCGIDGVIEEIYKVLNVDISSSQDDIFNRFITLINQEDVLKFAQALEATSLKTNAKIAVTIQDFLSTPSLSKFHAYHQAFFTKSNTARKISGKVLDNADLLDIFDSQLFLTSELLDKLNSHKIGQSTALLLKFIDHILEIYSDLKQRNCLLDYNDLITQTNKLLDNPEFSDWVKLKMDGFFDHILIDESQDTNHQQWNIIKSLTEDFFSGLSASNKDRTIFIVGDEKQSIYSFQGAEPNISQEIFSFFKEKLKDHPNQLLKINLDSSFRTLKNVLQCVDQTFAGEKEKAAIAKISDFEGHKAIREGDGRVEIWPQIKHKKEDSKSISHDWDIDLSAKENYQEQEFTSHYTALRIKALVDNKYILEGKNRPVEYGDFMILLRNRTNGFDKNLTQFFQKYNIPSASPSRIKFSDNIIIQDLLSAAKFALFPYDDLNLACLLKSPIFGIPEDTLFTLCSLKNNKKISLYDSLALLPEFQSISEDLATLIDNAKNLNCFDFFNYLLTTHDSRTKIIAQFGKEGAQILDKFTLKNFDFCQNFSNDLSKFLDFIEKLDPEFSLSSGENNQVIITTIHSAKGLQAPIVIIPDCCFNFNQLPGSKEKISWIKSNGYQLPIWCSKKDDQNKLLKEIAEQKMKTASDEYLRLLYVAMTRAENELYIGGIGKSKDEGSWYELIKRSAITSAWKDDFMHPDLKALDFDKFDFENAIYGFGPKNIPFTITQPKGVTTTEDYIEKKEATTHLAIANTKVKTNQISKSQLKGKLIHKILEIFGNNPQEDSVWLTDLAHMIISKEKSLDEACKNDIFTMIKAFLSSPHFKNLFLGEVRCEMEISGKIEKELINARLDLLVIKDDQALIVDYKTDKLASETNYTQQLQLYETLVRSLYPNHKVSSGILWLETLELDILTPVS